MKKVSFDFDSTLSLKEVQGFAKSLILKGYDVWICTSRLCPEKAPNNQWNDDLFYVATMLGIPREKIIFTNYEDKAEHLTEEFIWHLDDDWFEINEINRQKKVVGISNFGNKQWKKQCKELLQ